MSGQRPVTLWTLFVGTALRTKCFWRWTGHRSHGLLVAFLTHVQGTFRATPKRAMLGVVGRLLWPRPCPAWAKPWQPDSRRFITETTLCQATPARQPDSFCHPPLLWAPAWAKPWQPDQHHFNNFTDFTALPSQNPLSPALPYCQPFSWAKPRPCLGQALAFPNQPFHYPTRPPSSLRQVSRACWPGPSPCHFLPWAKPCPSLSQALGTPDLIFGLPFSKPSRP